MKNNWIYSKTTILIGILLAAGLWKGGLVLANAFPFNSDEAVVALMARHILNGERPVFFYGQAYMGSLDAYLIALGFAVFGIQVWVVRFVQGMIYLGWLTTTARIGWSAFKDPRIGLLGMGFLAFPTVNIQLYSTVTLGGYGEALLIGNLIILSAFRIANLLDSAYPVLPISENSRFQKSILKWVICFGLMSGLGVWVLPLTLLFSIPAGCFILYTLIKYRQLDLLRNGLLTLTCGIVPALIGAWPWWSYAIQNGMTNLLNEILGSAVAIEQVSYVLRTVNHLLYYLLFGLPVILGLRPPWAIRWLGLFLIPLVIAIWVLITVTSFRYLRRAKRRFGHYSVFLGIIILNVMAFVFTSFGADPSGRYFLPVSVPIALIAAAAIIHFNSPFKWIRWGLGGILIVFNIIGTLQSAAIVPPGITTQFDPVTIIDRRYDNELISFLKDQGETRGYTDYWVAYPLAFLSQEELIYIPRLPYHDDLRYTPRDDRYALYGEIVGKSDKVAYITTGHPVLIERLRISFTSLNIRWKEKTIGDYRIFYNLSARIEPQFLNLTPVKP